MVRILSIILTVILSCYIAFFYVLFHKERNEHLCQGIEIIVRDSLDKHFVNESDLISLLKRDGLSPLKKKLSAINTDSIEKHLIKNEMISEAEVYKTPSGKIKLEVTQKMPILRVMSANGAYYVDNKGTTMPISQRYVAHVPIATGYMEKEFAENELYEFALFLQDNEFWNNQIEQICVFPNKEVELFPRVGRFRIVLGSLDDFEEKLNKLRLFYDQAIPKVGWDKYSVIDLKYKNQIVCTKK